jgi:hypothetical protein
MLEFSRGPTTSLYRVMLWRSSLDQGHANGFFRYLRASFDTFCRHWNGFSWNTSSRNSSREGCQMENICRWDHGRGDFRDLDSRLGAEQHAYRRDGQELYNFSSRTQDISPLFLRIETHPNIESERAAFTSSRHGKSPNTRSMRYTFSRHDI